MVDTDGTLNMNVKSSGFTLIELLVSLGIIVIISGMGIASYSKFSQGQRLKQATLTLKNNLRLAQTNAMSALKPPGCPLNSTLTNYTVEIALHSYTVTYLCSDGTNGPVLTKTVPSDVTITGSDVTFLTLTKGSNCSLPCNINLSNASVTYTLTVSQNGDISGPN